MLRSGVAHCFFLFFFWVLWALVVRGWSRDGLRPSEVVHPTARTLLNKLLYL